MDDWYQLTVEMVTKHGGRTMIINYYNGSPFTALQAVYPEHEWLPWVFSATPKGLWTNRDNHFKFFDWLGKQLDIKDMDQWYKVKLSVIQVRIIPSFLIM